MALPETARAAASRWLALGLEGRGGAKVEDFVGNQPRAQLAAALVHEPELLVLDEPFAGLDLLAVHTLAEILRGEGQPAAARSSSPATSSSWWRTFARRSRSSTTDASSPPVTWTR